MTEDLMTEIAEIIKDIRKIEHDLNDPMRHCKSELKRLVVNILADAASQARDALLIVEKIKYDQARADADRRLDARRQSADQAAARPLHSPERAAPDARVV